MNNQLHGTWKLMDEEDGEREWADKPAHFFIVRPRPDGWYWQGVGENERFPSYWIPEDEPRGPFPTWQDAALDCEAHQ